LIDVKISGFELLEWAGSFVGYDTHLRYQLHSWLIERLYISLIAD
jgi:hypothetical protein